MYGSIQLKWTTKVIWIRGQCTPFGTQMASRIFAVPISNMVPAGKDDVGVKYSVLLQQSYITMEVNDV